MANRTIYLRDIKTAELIPIKVCDNGEGSYSLDSVARGTIVKKLVTKEIAAATAYTVSGASLVLSESASAGTPWVFDLARVVGGGGVITKAKVFTKNTAITPNFTMFLFNRAPAIGSVLANGTGTVTEAGALSIGSTTLHVTGAGVFTITLPYGVTGTLTNGTASITGSPKTLLAGVANSLDSGVTTGTLTLVLYGVTCAVNDHATNTADVDADVVLGYSVGRIDFPALTSLGGDSIGLCTPSTSGNIPIYFQCDPLDTRLYGILITNSTVTLTAGYNVSVVLIAEQY